jgi:adenylate cyclase
MDEITHAAFRFEGFTLDMMRRLLRAGDQEVELRAKSLDVLLYLVENAGRLVTKEEIIQAVWQDVVATDESLTQCISDVRQAIGDTNQAIIKTVRRHGYLFASPVARSFPGALAIASSVAEEPAIPAGSSAGKPTAEASVPKWAFRPWHAAAGALIGIVAIIATMAAILFFPLQPAGLTLPDRPSIAVLPFVQYGDDATQDYFSDGISEDLTTNLSKFGELFVISRDSAFKYKGQSADARRIGRELGVRYLVQGSVRKDADRMRITTELVDASTDKQLWAEHYDRAVTGVFAVQDDVTQNIVVTLISHITQSELDRALAKPPESLAAYEDNLRANALIKNMPRDPAAIEAARALYEKALATDPRYAQAMQGLANTYYLSWEDRGSPEFQQQAALDRAQSLAQQAIDLDGALSEAHATLGWILSRQGHNSQGIAEFERAFELNPNFVDGRFGLLLSHAGRAPDAVEYMKRIMRLDPFYPPNYTYWLGKGYYFMGKYEQAIELIRSASARLPGHEPSRVLLAAVAAQLGRKEEARAAASEVMQIQPDFTISGWLKFLNLSDPAYADRLTDGLRKAKLPD